MLVSASDRCSILPPSVLPRSFYTVSAPIRPITSVWWSATFRYRGQMSLAQPSACHSLCGPILLAQRHVLNTQNYHHCDAMRQAFGVLADCGAWWAFHYCWAGELCCSPEDAADVWWWAIGCLCSDIWLPCIFWNGCWTPLEGSLAWPMPPIRCVGDPPTAAPAPAVHLRSARLPRSAPGRPGPPTTPVTPVPAAQPPTPCPPPLRLPPPPPPCSLPRLPHRHPAQQSCALAPPSRPPACLPLPWGTIGFIHTYSSPAQFCCAPRLPVGGTTCSVPKQRCAVHLSGLDK